MPDEKPPATASQPTQETVEEAVEIDPAAEILITRELFRAHGLDPDNFPPNLIEILKGQSFKVQNETIESHVKLFEKQQKAGM